VCSEIFLGYKPKHSEWDPPGYLLQIYAPDPNEYRDAPDHTICPLPSLLGELHLGILTLLMSVHPSMCPALGSMAKHRCCRQLDCTETGDLLNQDSIPGNPNQDLLNPGCTVFSIK